MSVLEEIYGSTMRQLFHSSMKIENEGYSASCDPYYEQLRSRYLQMLGALEHFDEDMEIKQIIKEL